MAGRYAAMGNRQSSSLRVPSIATRLSRLAQLDAEDLRALALAEASVRRVSAHREIVSAGSLVTEPSVLLSGWACRSRIFSDGRRQILSLVLPGDLIGVCPQAQPIAATDIVALTDVVLCAAPSPRPHAGGLADAYAGSGAIEEFYLFRQIARLGRLSAFERMIDLFFEIRDRLAAVDLGTERTFPVPVTQEVLADLLGLTTVHINRTFRTLRQDGLLELRSGMAQIKDLDRLAELVEHRPAIIASQQIPALAVASPSHR